MTREPDDSFMPPQRSLSVWRRLGYWLFGLLVLGAVVLMVLRLAELERFAELARAAQPQWLILAVGLQLLTYICVAWVWHSALTRVGQRRPLGSLVPLGVAKLFTD